uniref:Glycosyl transferase family 2 n=1 Tax=Geobacter sp. (strain M21) TaxID=443144 RepID=C6E5K2_GEOSM
MGKSERQESVKLSVLVPVYNWDVSLLVRKLIEEADSSVLWAKIEIIVIDDHSTDPVTTDTSKILECENQRSGFHYSRLPQNVGRSAVRNLLAAKAKGEFLLFLDCDVAPDSKHFLASYLEFAEKGSHDVICGGRSYNLRVMTDEEYDYYVYFGNVKEVKSAAERNIMPWRHLLTSNVMVRKKALEETPFNENFVGYGYEDIEWGVRLAQAYSILHIDNTASHLGLVTKQKAYEKMRESVSNYLLLRDLYPLAFNVSAISKVVRLLESVPAPLLGVMDRLLKNMFLSSGSNRLAFLFFQLDFAVLLACTLRARQRDLLAPKPAQGGKR